MSRTLQQSAALVAATLLYACAAVPEALDPGPSLRPLVTVAARGVQIHECRAGPRGPAWVFVAPEAELLDAEGRVVGTHGAGPHWTAGDGSRIEGTVAARSEAPAAGAIPWLLLKTRSTGGPGRWQAVQAVQRIHTEGGVAPTRGCDAIRLGVRARVPYRADYRLFVAP